jgi:hypothetical protein
MLYHAVAEHLFDEISEQAGTLDGGWGWGTVAADLDQDGLLDLVEVNGWPDGPFGGYWGKEPARLFHNQGGMSFADIALASGLDHTGQGRSLLYLDGEGDGDLDLLITGYLEPLSYYRNDTSGAGHWLQVVLDTTGNPLLAPDGFGARVEIVADGLSCQRPMNGSPSYLGTSELVAHFGLGPATVVDELTVHWPRGQVTCLADVAADQRLVIEAPGLGDLNADGVVAVDDLVELVLSWGPVADAFGLKADLNGDRVVDVDDLIGVIARWGN